MKTKMVFLSAILISLVLFDKICIAQVGNPMAKSDEPTVETVVTIPSGETTLAKFLQLLSSLTKVKISPVNYLAERRLCLVMGSISAKKALDIICEANGWQWVKKSDKSIEVTSPNLPAPNGYADISSLMRRALPRDLAVYLHFDKLDSKDPDERSMPLTSSYNLWQRTSIPRASMIEILTSNLVNKDRLMFKSINATEKEVIVAFHFFRFLKDASDVLFDNFGPHMLDFSSLTIGNNMGLISIKGKMFTGHNMDTINTGFGIGNISNP